MNKQNDMQWQTLTQSLIQLSLMSLVYFRAWCYSGQNGQPGHCDHHTTVRNHANFKKSCANRFYIFFQSLTPETNQFTPLSCFNIVRCYWLTLFHLVSHSIGEIKASTRALNDELDRLNEAGEDVDGKMKEIQCLRCGKERNKKHLG